MLEGQCNFKDAVKRANCHFRYWKYRKKFNNGGPSFIRTCLNWYSRFVYEWLGNGHGA